MSKRRTRKKLLVVKTASLEARRRKYKIIEPDYLAEKRNTMYLDLVCKYGDWYALRDEKAGYAYYTKSQLLEKMQEVDNSNRNFICHDDEIVKVAGRLPILGQGINYVHRIDNRMTSVMYVSNPEYWLNANISMLVLNDMMLQWLKHCGYIYLDDVNFRDEDGNDITVLQMPLNVKIVLCINTLLEQDRLCTVNITGCDMTDDSFVQALTRFKTVFLYDEELINSGVDIRDVDSFDDFNTAVYLDGELVRPAKEAEPVLG